MNPYNTNYCNYCCGFASVSAWMYIHTYISSIVISGFHKTSKGRETVLMPQKSSGFHPMCWFCQLYRGKQKRDQERLSKNKHLGRNKKVLFKGKTFECPNREKSDDSFNCWTHSDNPNVRNEHLVDLSLWTSKEICMKIFPVTEHDTNTTGPSQQNFHKTSTKWHISIIINFLKTIFVRHRQGSYDQENHLCRVKWPGICIYIVVLC